MRKYIGVMLPLAALLIWAGWLAVSELGGTGGIDKFSRTDAGYASDGLRPGVPAGFRFLDRRRADVTGDGRRDYVELYGRLFPGSTVYYDKLLIAVSSGIGGRPVLVKPPAGAEAGYGPSLWTGDLTRDKVADVVMLAESGGSGNFKVFAGYSMVRGKSRLILDSVDFTGLNVKGRFMDGYRAVVKVIETGKTYRLDLKDRKEFYDTMGVYEDGRLVKPVDVWINPIGLIRFVDPDRDGAYDLKGIQQVKGVANVDTIADTSGLWRWLPGAGKGVWKLLTARLLPS